MIYERYAQYTRWPTKRVCLFSTINLSNLDRSESVVHCSNQRRIANAFKLNYFASPSAVAWPEIFGQWVRRSVIFHSIPESPAQLIYLRQYITNCFSNQEIK